jgi:mono/diheme cytochrome c family protein
VSPVVAERRGHGQLGIAAAVLLAAFGCSKSPTDLREWSPKDHTNTGGNNSVAPTGQVNAAPAATETPPRGLDAVTLGTWGAQCASCHGKIGKGDGPMGPMVKASDLSNPEWQASVTDEQIRAVLVNGKNSMPAFNNLPAETLDDLVWLVRWFNADQTAIEARMKQLKGEASPAPAPSAPAPSSPTTAAGVPAPAAPSAATTTPPAAPTAP